MTQPISLLRNGSHLSIDEGKLMKGNFFKHLFSPSFHQNEVEKVVQFIKEKFPQDLPLADALIKRYRYDKSVQKLMIDFDRLVAPSRETLSYLCPETQKSFKKWRVADQPSEIFRDHPKFVQFLGSSGLLSQIKVTRDQVQLIDGVPALFVNGEWVKENDLYERFEVIDSSFYGQKFIVEKKTREVYTYLDNGKGLQPHHPFRHVTPISKLNDADYLRVLECAGKAFPSEEERPFILQIVSSRIQVGNSNFAHLLRNAKHPYLRLIIGKDNPELNTHKGEVYEVGYGWKSPSTPPLIASQGRFRAPDVWEYKTPDERIVTNIPLSQEAAHGFYDFTMRYHLDGVNLGIEPGFHLAEQNCSVYLREACAAAGIDVPTAISTSEIIQRILPDWIRKTGSFIAAWNHRCLGWFSRQAHRFTPQCFLNFGGRIRRAIEKACEALAALATVPVRISLGDFKGNGGAAFRQHGENPEQVTPSLRNWRNVFSLPRWNLPAVLQEWQLAQPSTVIYKKPVKLTIVP